MRQLLYDNFGDHFGFHCSECDWKYLPHLMEAETFRRMLELNQERCELEFRHHLCVDYRNMKTKGAT